ncbi:uncharacterized protein PHALS_14541 [Plasmopara halstedii]|uniref:Uncharacterized protein n=1 Tax=Plasmopara halstedii TaxID=4781 RepID=A0A0P1AKW8_PLAHL|nr:uncharacterized protein PHALS_14541 [Plasmopara halstedii]CEG41573.1 hypothetical protein PHALS_14541 [Plasmopara halstedii]|eukprot:XP_024577942.1 hypothetical protein PHALS_14541 [Plasmopara halstedii]
MMCNIKGQSSVASSNEIRLGSHAIFVNCVLATSPLFSVPVKGKDSLTIVVIISLAHQTPTHRHPV